MYVLRCASENNGDEEGGIRYTFVHGNLFSDVLLKLRCVGWSSMKEKPDTT